MGSCRNPAENCNNKWNDHKRFRIKTKIKAIRLFDVQHHYQVQNGIGMKVKINLVVKSNLPFWSLNCKLCNNLDRPILYSFKTFMNCLWMAKLFTVSPLNLRVSSGRCKILFISNSFHWTAATMTTRPPIIFPGPSFFFRELDSQLASIAWLLKNRTAKLRVIYL